MMPVLRNKPSRLATLALVAAGTLVLAGCYEDIGATRYEPGVYKGSEDPLNAKLESGELQEELARRFEIAARDR